MRRRSIWIAGMMAVAPAAAGAQGGVSTGGGAPGRIHAGHTSPTPGLVAVPRTTPIQLDGRLDDAAWQAATPAAGFIQQAPTDGAPATQQTEIRMLFDEHAIYVGARMYDTEGAAGVRTRLARRDQFVDGDWLDLIFDTFHDHVGRTFFSVNPSGVKRDAGVASAFTDNAWDAVWEVATAVDSLGWVAEFRIPLSQLRFSTSVDQTWGLQVWRTASRLNELSMWSYWGRQDPGGPQRFGHIEGLQLRGRPARAEVLPYVVGQMDRLKDGPAGDPFYDQHRGAARVGADLKYLISNSLTLDATVNPDFGQVEVDPAVVNLSAFETFFQERRPFFVSGGGNFGFGSLSCYFCSNASNLGLFYSRRIGRVPQGSVPDGTTFSDYPEATSIRGAAKLTGRTRSGWTIGVLDAVTAREEARVLVDQVERRTEVEPLSNYFVGRLRKDLRNGNAFVGMMATSVVRDLADSPLEPLVPRHAEALGLDWSWTWKNRTYSFVGTTALSNVSGDSSAMLRLQRSSARYFQRPDRQAGGNGLFSDRLDPSLTRLGGYGFYSRLAKEAGTWQWETAVNLRSPGFEVNDLAFLTRADYVWVNANLLRNWSKPTSWYRTAAAIVGAQQQFNYDGDRTDVDAHVWGRIELLNYWNIGGFHIRRPEVFDDRALRGGPTVRRPASEFSSVFLNTDSRRTVAFNAQVGTGSNAEGSRGWETSGGVTLRPTSNVQVSLSPGYNRSSSSQFYVAAVTDPTAVAFGGRRYVVADFAQDDLSFNTRVNVTFSPTLTLEVFAQPLLSSVRFDGFKEFDAPRTTHKSVYGADRGTITPLVDEAGRRTGYDIDPDGAGPAAPFQLANPDFRFQSLRGNAVLRWEFRPGSTVYLVWTQSRANRERFVNGIDVGDNLDTLGHLPADNIFLVKFNYWLSF